MFSSDTSSDAMYVSPAPQATKPDSPSPSFRAPHPPGCGSTTAKGSRVRSSTPARIVARMERKWPADSRSGTCGAKAFQTRSTEYDIDSQYVDVGAGQIGRASCRERVWRCEAA